jgi:tetratricopeptide (TPR) repeat protein
MSSDPTSRHDRVASVFAALVALPEPERERRLGELRNGDAPLADEVAELIRLDSEMSALDRRPPGPWAMSGPPETTGSQRSAPSMPDHVGPYEIVNVLGRGGMGVVYRARQMRPRRDVALKLVRASLIAPGATKQLRQEADILARLTHPGIAQVYDAGTASDRGADLSYFAMELVDGAPITKHAHETGLSFRGRAALLASVCDAVQHAHQRGVIHRDLKPANLLVGSDGRARVLDFGIARLVEPGVQVTTIGEQTGLVGTLAYMSPEQLSGEASRIDTRTDVYALGAVLYELLTGCTPVPLESLTLTQAVHALQTQRPRRPGQIDPRVPRDLETIALKAIAPEPERRYDSASRLAEDLRRFLASEPIAARPATVRYRVARFAARHPGAVVGIAAALLLLATTIGAIGFGYRESVRRVDALEQANREVALQVQRAEAVNEFLRRMLVSADPLGETGRGRADTTVVEMLDRESGQIEQAFEGLPESEASVRSTIGNVYLSLGMFERAEPQLRRAVELHEDVWGVDSPDADRARRDLAVLLAETDRVDEAVATFESIVQRQIDSGRDHTTEHAITAARLGAVLLDLDRYEEAEHWLSSALGAFEQQPTPPRADLMPITMNNLAQAVRGLGDRERAEALYVRARDALINVHGVEHASVAVAENNIATLRVARGDYAGAAESFRQAIAILGPLLGEGHPTLAAVRHNLAYALYDMGAYEDALAELRVSLAAYRAVYGDDHPETLSTQMGTADTLLKLEQYDEGAAMFADTADRLLARDPEDPRAQRARFFEGMCRVRGVGGTDAESEGQGDAVMDAALVRYIELAGAGTATAQKMIRGLIERRIEQERTDDAVRLAVDLDPGEPQNAALRAALGLD